MVDGKGGEEEERENGRRDYVAGLSVNTTHFELEVRTGRYSRIRRDRSITQKCPVKKKKKNILLVLRRLLVTYCLASKCCYGCVQHGARSLLLVQQ